MSLHQLQSFGALAEDTPYRSDAIERRGRHFAVRGGVVLILIVAAYWPALRGEFLWHDEVLIQSNPAAHTLGLLVQSWLHPSWSSLPPVANALLYLEHTLWGTAPLGYRLCSIMMHATATWLLWATLRRLDVPGAWLGAALFALHPVQVQAVAWVSQQPLLLSACWFLGSLLLSLRFFRIAPESLSDWGEVDAADFDEEPLAARFRLVSAALLTYLAAVWSDAGAVVLPAVLAVLLWWRRPAVEYRRNPLWLTPFGVVAVATMAAHFWLASTNPPPGVRGSSLLLDGFRPGDVLAELRTIGRSAAALVWPHRLLFAYGHGQWTAPMLGGLSALVVMGALVTALWVMRRRQVAVALAVSLGIFLVIVAPQAWRVEVRGSLAAHPGSQVAYLASAAFFASVAAGAVKLADRLHSPGAVLVARWALGVIPVGLLVALVWHQSSAYASGLNLWQDWLVKEPLAVFPRCRLAEYHLDHGEVELASQQVLTSNGARAAQPDPRVTPERLVVDWATTRARVLEARSAHGEAVAELQNVLRVWPANKLVAARLANLLARMGRTDDAIAALELALSVDPRDAALHNECAVLLLSTRRVREAAEHCRLAVELDPTMLPARLNYANALFAMGELPRAAEQLQEARKIGPRNFEAYMNAGAMLGQLKDFVNAERMLRAAVELRPDSAEARNNLGIALAAQGHLQEAAFSFARAVALRPDYADAARNLEAAKRQLAAKGHPPTTSPR